MHVIHLLQTLNQTQMKKILLFLAITATVSTTKSFSQDAQQQSQLSQLLTQYYTIKDALVAGNGTNASTSA